MNLNRSKRKAQGTQGKGIILTLAAVFMMFAGDLFAQTQYEFSTQQRRLGDQLGVEIWAKKVDNSAPRIGNMSISVTYNTDQLQPASSGYAINTTDSVNYNPSESAANAFVTINSVFHSANGYAALSAQAVNNGTDYAYQLDINAASTAVGSDVTSEGRGTFVGKLVFDIINHANLDENDLSGITLNTATNLGDFVIFDLAGNNIESGAVLNPSADFNIKGITILNPNGPNEALNRNKTYNSLSPVAGYPLYFERSGLITPSTTKKYGSNALAYSFQYSIDNGANFSSDVIRVAEHRETATDLGATVDNHVSGEIVTNTGDNTGYYITQGNGSQIPIAGTGDGYGGVLRVIWDDNTFFAPRSEEAKLRICQLAETVVTNDIDTRTSLGICDDSDNTFVLSRLFFIQLDGTEDYMRTRDRFSAPTELTVEAWINLNSYNANPDAEPGIVVHGPGPQKTDEEGTFSLYLHEGRYPAFRVIENQGGAGRGEDGGKYVAKVISPDAIAVSDASSPISNDHSTNWTHIAGVVDGNTVMLYVDGELKAKTVNNNTVDIMPKVTSHWLWLGINPYEGIDASSYLHAGIKEVKVWRKALSSDALRSYISGVDDTDDFAGDENLKALEIYYDFNGASEDLAIAPNSTGVTENGSQQNGVNPIFYYEDPNILSSATPIPEERYPYRPDRAHLRLTSPATGSGVKNTEGYEYPVRWISFGVGTPQTTGTNDVVVEFSRDGGDQWAIAIDGQTPGQLINGVDAEDNRANWEAFESATVAGSYNDLQSVIPTSTNYSKTVQLRIRGAAANSQDDIVDATGNFTVAPFFAFANTGESIVEVDGSNALNIAGGTALIEAWIKPYRFPTENEGLFPIIVKKDTVSDTGHYGMYLNDKGQIRLDLTNQDGTIVTALSDSLKPVIEPNTLYADSIWTHVAAFVNLGNGGSQSESSVIFYIDGNPQTEAAITGQLGSSVNLNTANEFPTYIAFDTDEAQVPQLDVNGDPVLDVNGDPIIDDVRTRRSFIGELKGIRFWNGSPANSSYTGVQPTELTNFLRGAQGVLASELTSDYRANLVASFDACGDPFVNSEFPHNSLFSYFPSGDTINARIVKNNGAFYSGVEPTIKVVEPVAGQQVANSEDSLRVRWVGFNYDRTGFTTGDAATNRDSDLEYSTQGGGGTVASPYNATASDNDNATFTDAYGLPQDDEYRFAGTNPPYSQFAGTLNIGTARVNGAVQEEISASNTEARLRMRGRKMLNTPASREYTSFEDLISESQLFTITPPSNFTIRTLLEGYHKGAAQPFTGNIGATFEENGIRITLFKDNSGAREDATSATMISGSDYNEKDPLSGPVRGQDGSEFGNLNFVFTDIENGKYWVLLEHQNHLPVMSRYAAPFNFDGDNLATWAIESGWDFQNWDGDTTDILTQTNANTSPVTFGDSYSAFGAVVTDAGLTDFSRTGLRYNEGQSGTGTTNGLAAMVAGDIVKDGLINAADRVTVRGDVGSASMRSDVTGDGNVDAIDRTITDRNFGAVYSVAPEFPALYSAVTALAPGLSDGNDLSVMDGETAQRLTRWADRRNTETPVASKFTSNSKQAGLSYVVTAETSINEAKDKIEITMYVRNNGDDFAFGNSTFGINYDPNKLEFGGLLGEEASLWHNDSVKGYGNIYSAPTLSTKNPINNYRTIEIDYDAYANLRGTNVPFNNSVLGTLVFNVKDPNATKFDFDWAHTVVLDVDGKDITPYGNFLRISPINTIVPLELITPNGGEEWKDGIANYIRWALPSEETQVMIEGSVDFGATWFMITNTPVSSNEGEYLWTPDGINSTECLIKVIDAASNTEIDRSESAFSITPAVAKVITPNYAQGILYGGRNAEITWILDDELASTVNFRFSTNGQTGWVDVATNVNGQSAATPFRVPANINSDRAVIAMFSAETNEFLAASEPFRVLAGTLNFTSPVEGAIVASGDTERVKWLATGVSNFTLQLTLDGVTWQTVEPSLVASSNNYLWEVPTVSADTDNAAFRALWNGNADMVYDVSDNFSIKSTISVEENFGGEFAVENAYPNPVVDESVVKFNLPESVQVTVELFDTKGSLVNTVLANEFRAAGPNQIDVDGTGLAAGVYYLQITAGDNQHTQELIIK
ncbi:MAG: hypothetical protein Kapaf2KO_01010 [Candidatus Kapaibacteriales bacterium]